MRNSFHFRFLFTIHVVNATKRFLKDYAAVIRSKVIHLSSFNIIKLELYMR